MIVGIQGKKKEGGMEVGGGGGGGGGERDYILYTYHSISTLSPPEWLPY